MSHSTIFQSCQDISCVQPELSGGSSFLLKDTTQCLWQGGHPKYLDSQASPKSVDPDQTVPDTNLHCLHRSSKILGSKA